MSIAPKTRRQILRDSYLGLGSLALTSMLQGATAHHKSKAKNCIFLFLEGQGLSEPRP